MTKTLVFKEYSTTKNIVKSNSLFIIICSVFILSLLVGSFAISVCDNPEFFGLKDYFNGYIVFLKNSSFVDIFVSSFFMFTLMILLNYILGLCVIGNFINGFILFLFGFGIGSASGYLYRMYTINGVCFFALVILPGLFLFCINYILSFKQSFKFSAELFKLIKNSNNVNLKFKNYSIKFLIYFIFTVFICIINAFLTGAFSSVFKF